MKSEICILYKLMDHDIPQVSIGFKIKNKYFSVRSSAIIAVKNIICRTFVSQYIISIPQRITMVCIDNLIVGHIQNVIFAKSSTFCASITFRKTITGTTCIKKYLPI